MPIDRRSLLAGLLALAPLPTLAQSPLPWRWPGAPDPTLAAFEGMLALLPAALVTPGEAWVEHGFGDPAAARGMDVAGPDLLTLPRRQALRAMPVMTRASDLIERNGDWRRAAGFHLDDVQQLALITRGRDIATLMQLAPGVGARVEQALQAGGYARAEEAGLVALTVGPDGGVSLEARNRDDPFRGPTGRSARVQVEGDLLRHTNTWPLLATLAGTDASALTDPGIAALLAGLAGVQGGPLVSAFLMPDAARLGGADPFQTVTGRATPGGPAGWQGLVFADFTTGPQSTAVMVATLPWPEGEPLEPLIQAVRQGWETAAFNRTTLAERHGAVLIEATRAPGGLAWLRMWQSAETGTSRTGHARNSLHQDLLLATVTGQLRLLP